jgi:hypothetical protein
VKRVKREESYDVGTRNGVTIQVKGVAHAGTSSTDGQARRPVA